MKLKTIEVTKKDQVATIKLNRPELLNAVNEQLVWDFQEATKNATVSQISAFAGTFWQILREGSLKCWSRGSEAQLLRTGTAGSTEKNQKISGLKKEAPVDKGNVWNCYFLALAGEGPI